MWRAGPLPLFLDFLGNPLHIAVVRLGWARVGHTVITFLPLSIGRMNNTFSHVHFLTVTEVAQMMRVSTMTVYRMVHSGEIPAIRFGRSFRIPEEAVTQMLSGPFGEENLHQVG